MRWALGLICSASVALAEPGDTKQQYAVRAGYNQSLIESTTGGDGPTLEVEAGWRRRFAAATLCLGYAMSRGVYADVDPPVSFSHHLIDMRGRVSAAIFNVVPVGIGFGFEIYNGGVTALFEVFGGIEVPVHDHVRIVFNAGFVVSGNIHVRLNGGVQLWRF